MLVLEIVRGKRHMKVDVVERMSELTVSFPVHASHLVLYLPKFKSLQSGHGITSPQYYCTPDGRCLGKGGMLMVKYSLTRKQDFTSASRISAILCGRSIQKHNYKF